MAISDGADGFASRGIISRERGLDHYRNLEELCSRSVVLGGIFFAIGESILRCKPHIPCAPVLNGTVLCNASAVTSLQAVLVGLAAQPHWQALARELGTYYPTLRCDILLLPPTVSNPRTV